MLILLIQLAYPSDNKMNLGRNKDPKTTDDIGFKVEGDIYVYSKEK